MLLFLFFCFLFCVCVQFFFERSTVVIFASARVSLNVQDFRFLGTLFTVLVL